MSRIGLPVFGARIRSSSVPAGHYERTSVPDLEAARKANLIAHFAAEDSDAIAAASRRHDRDFLYDISNKLATVNTVNHSPSPARSTYYVPPPAPRIVHRRPPPPPPSTIRRSLLTPEDNYDIAAYLQRAPSVLPYSRSVRSASVPPPSGSVLRPTVPRWFPTSPAYYGRRGGNYVPGVVPVGLPPPMPRGDRMDAMTDGVVGVAHTSLYGDIVIGIPYKKRFMFNAQNNGPNDFDTQSLPPMHLSLPTRVVSAGPHFASYRQTPAASIAISKPYSRASYAAPPTAYQRQQQQLLTRPLAHYINDAVDVYDDYDAIVSTKSRHPVSSARSKILKQELESDIANSIFGDEYAGPPRRSTLSKDYKAVLSRYSLPPPTTNGPRHLAASLPDPELDRKYEHVLASMQPLMTSSVSYGKAPVAGGTYSSVVPPSNAYATHSSSLPPPYAAPKSYKPAVSETRRKLRDLLCRTRNDPHYFDD